MKVLVLKPSSLGDVIQALPVLRLLRQHLPQAEIHWWIDRRLASLLDHDPDLTGIIPFDRQRWRSPWRWLEVGQHVHSIRAQRFDWVIDLQSLFRSGAVSWLANGAFTIGLDDPREGAPAFYDVAVPRPSPLTHAVDWYLEVLRPLGVPVHRSFTWLPAQPEIAAEVQARWQPGPGPWIALQPGARWANKRWPIRHFVATVQELARLHPDAHFAVLGAESEHPLGSVLDAAVPGRCLDLTGRTSLLQMIEWVRRCALIITNDTGPMHVAAALDKPVVAIFGPTEPRRTGPYGQVSQVLRHPLPCAPCLKDSCRWVRPLECVEAVTPARVVAQVTAHLQPPPPTLPFRYGR